MQTVGINPLGARQCVSQEKQHEVRIHGKILAEVPLPIEFNLAGHPNPTDFLILYLFYPMNQEAYEGIPTFPPQAAQI